MKTYDSFSSEGQPRSNFNHRGIALRTNMTRSNFNHRGIALRTNMQSRTCLVIGIFACLVMFVIGVVIGHFAIQKKVDEDNKTETLHGSEYTATEFWGKSNNYKHGIQPRIRGSYKAAVFEHALVFPRSKVDTYKQAVDQMMPNLLEYEKQARFAGAKGVDIIVFPEDGLYGYLMKQPAEIEPYLEFIPDPNSVDWNPCEDPNRFNRTVVQTFLSCLAKNNSLYLVVNYGDAQPCDSQDPNCPPSGQYQYNTDIAFDRNGKLIARYHKQNLFFETQFNEPIYPETVYFDTDFGRFGMFTCFDILFNNPAIPLIETFNITNVAFPTAWMDALPFLSAIGYHSSFATAYKVNVLAANLHIPTEKFQGSGIYTPQGANEFFYDRVNSNGKLLISDVSVIPDRQTEPLDIVKFTFGPSEMTFYRESEFKSVVFHDWYSMVSLSKPSDNITICQRGHCCFLSYQSKNLTGHYAFGVFNGIHPKDGPYYLQVCILLKCLDQSPKSCGQLIFDADRRFEYFQMKGNFSTPYVTPQVVLSSNGSLLLPSKNSFQYDKDGFTSSVNDYPLLEVTLLGRVFLGD